MLKRPQNLGAGYHVTYNGNSLPFQRITISQKMLLFGVTVAQSLADFGSL